MGIDERQTREGGSDILKPKVGKNKIPLSETTQLVVICPSSLRHLAQWLETMMAFSQGFNR